MKNTKQYRFSHGKDEFIIFDSNGYVVDTKGIGNNVWCEIPETFDKELIGKHVEEVADLIHKHTCAIEYYYNFQISVHLELLKKILRDKSL